MNLKRKSIREFPIFLKSLSLICDHCYIPEAKIFGLLHQKFLGAYKCFYNKSRIFSVGQNLLVFFPSK